MDTEQTINNQPEPQERIIPKENPADIFKKTLETSNQTMSVLVDFATENGVAAERLSHVVRVFEADGHILLPPIDTMRCELAKIQGESDRTRRTRALTARKTGEVFVPEEQAGSVHDIFHESIHRAAWLVDRQQGLGISTTDIVRKLASHYGIAITEDGRVDPNSEYIKQYAETDEEIKNLIEFFTETLRGETLRLTEGITEWTTRRARDIAREKGITIEMAEEDMAYDDEVQYVDEIRTRLKEKEGLTDKVADAKVISAAISGNIIELVPYL